MRGVVIFDMDGTLVDSQQDITRSINYVRQEYYKLEPLDASYVVEVINRPVRDLAKLFYNADAYHPKAKELFEMHYNQQCVESVYLYEGIKETLIILKEQGYQLSVATNAPTPFAQKIMAHLKIDYHFDYIIGADKVNNSKPHPDMLELILQGYNYTPSTHKAWMIGDSPNDILAAHNANIEAIFAGWGFSKASKDMCVVHKPSDILVSLSK